VASAAILAGGQARRFGGSDKRELVVGGRRIIERQLDALRQLTDDIMIVGGRQNEQIAGVRLLDDRVSASGPLAGLEAALGAARDDELMLVACDMPFITADFLAPLLELTAW
jgi:molybdopterin-guanine dinucleotide biosynthesis protein A